MRNKLFLFFSLLPLMVNAQISAVTEVQKQQALQTVSNFCSLFTRWANGQRTLDTQIYALCSGNDCSAYDDVSTNKETTLRNYLLGIQKKYPKSLTMQISQPSLANSSITYEPEFEVSSYIGNLDGEYSPGTMGEVQEITAGSYENAYIVFKINHSIPSLGKNSSKMIIYDVKAQKISAFITGQGTLISYIEGLTLMTKKDYKNAILKFEAAAANNRSSFQKDSYNGAMICCCFLFDFANARRYAQMMNDVVWVAYMDAMDKLSKESYAESLNLWLKCERLINETNTNLLSLPTVYYECGLLYGAFMNDYKKAVYYFKKAIELDHVQSAFWLWRLYMEVDLDETIISDDEMMKHLRWAAGKGHPGAILLVAKFEEAQQNVNDAIIWYEKGANKGDVFCMACLGKMLLKKDRNSASIGIKWLKKTLEGNLFEQELKAYDWLINDKFWPKSRADVQKLLNENQGNSTTVSSTTTTNHTHTNTTTNNNTNYNTHIPSSTAAISNNSNSTTSNHNYRRRSKFNHAQDEFSGGFSVGYIQKQWTVEENGEKEKGGLFDDDKYLHGIQAGFRVDPQFGAGFGINSGLFYEYCWAKSDEEHNSYGTYHTTYEEHGLYLPTHLKFTMNFSKWFQLSLYGGLGFYYALSGHAYWRNEGETYDTENVFSEEDNWRKFNMMYEYGISVRINALQIDVTQSQGLNNWSDTDGLKIKQGRPLSISATICF